MHSFPIFSRQSILLTSASSDVAKVLSTSTYLSIEQFSDISMNNISNFKITVLCRGYVVIGREATFFKTMLYGVTFLQADLTQPITFKMLISLIISDVCLLSSTLEITYLMSNLRYFNFKALIIPASKGCNFDVMFLGRNTNFMFYMFFSIDSWWLVALSGNTCSTTFSIPIVECFIY